MHAPVVDDSVVVREAARRPSDVGTAVLAADAVVDDGCLQWVRDRWRVAASCPPSAQSVDGNAAPQHQQPQLELANNVSVCMSRLWPERLLNGRVLSKECSWASTHCEQHAVARHCHIDGGGGVLMQSPTLLLLDPLHCERLEHSIVARKEGSMLRICKAHQPSSSAPPAASSWPAAEGPPRAAVRATEPPLQGYVLPVSPIGDTVRFLLAGAVAPPPLAPSSQGHACGQDPPVVVAARWKCRGTVSLMDHRYFLQMQRWFDTPPTEKRGSGASTVPWVRRVLSWVSASCPWMDATLQVYQAMEHRPHGLQTAVWPSRDAVNPAASELPLSVTAPTTTCAPSWARCSGVTCTATLRNAPRWRVLGEWRREDIPIASTAKKGRSSDAADGDAVNDVHLGVLYDSSPQQAPFGGVMWRTALEGKFGCTTASPRPSSLRGTDRGHVAPSGAVRLHGVAEVPLTVKKRSVVLRARYLAATRLFAPVPSEKGPSTATLASLGALQVPTTLVRGALFHCPGIAAERTVAACSLELQVPAVFGSAMDLTWFCNALGVDGGLGGAPTLWSCGYAVSPSATAASVVARRGTVTAWNTWLPQRMDCSMPVWRGGRAFHVDGSRGGGPIVSWLPRCGIVWDL